MLPEYYIKYKNEKMCLAGKDHFIDNDFKVRNLAYLFVVMKNRKA